MYSEFFDESNFRGRPISPFALQFPRRVRKPAESPPALPFSLFSFTTPRKPKVPKADSSATNMPIGSESAVSDEVSRSSTNDVSMMSADVSVSESPAPPPAPVVV